MDTIVHKPKENIYAIAEATLEGGVKKMGRPRGGPNNTKLSGIPKYYRDYYHKHLGTVIECPLCKRPSTKQKLKRHQTTNVCFKNRTLDMDSGGSNETHVAT